MADRLTGRSRLGIPPALRAALQYIEKTDSNTGLDLEGNVILGADNRYIAFGASGATDSKIYFSSNLTFYDSVSGAKTLAQLITGASTLDNSFDQTNGTYIDSSTATGDGNAFSVGGAATDDKVEIYHSGTAAYINARADNLFVTAAGGTIDLNDDNMQTTGSITCHGIVNTTTVIDSTAAIQIGADNTKLTLGADDATDSYLQFDAAALEVYCSGSIEFQPTADTTNYIIFSAPTNVPTISTAGANNLTITSNSGTISFNDELLTTSGTVTAGTLTIGAGSITDSSGAIDFGNEALTTQGNITIDSDSAKMYFGDAQSSYIYEDGTDLIFYDPHVGSTVKLNDMASGALSSPTVAGDMTITDGKLTWTDATDEVAGVWTFAGTTNDDVQWASSVTTADALQITTTALDSGSIVKLIADESVPLAGEYINCYDSNGASSVFAVKRYGEVEISGNASNDMLTITAGDIQLTEGDIDMDDGVITIDTDNNEGNTIKRNNATGTNPVLEVEQSNATGGVALLVDQDATGDVNALEITNAGTGYAVTNTGGAAGSEGYEMIFATGGTGNGIFLDGNTNTYVGADGAGMIHAHQSGTLAHANATMCFLNFDGTYAASGIGGCILIDDDGTASGTNYSVGVNSALVNCMHLTTGATTMTQLTVDGPTSQTASSIVIDGTTGAAGFIGAAATGMLHLKQDGGTMAHATTSLCYIDFDGTADTNQEGTCLILDDDGTADGTNYSMYINSNAVNCAKFETANVGMTALTLEPATNATAAALLIDGDANGWGGANGVGMLHLQSDIAGLHANASCLVIDKTAAIAEVNDARGSCMRIIDGMNVSASTPAYAVYISSTNNEALYVDAGTVVVDETVTASGGMISKHLTTNFGVDAVPTNAELAAAFAFTTSGQFGTVNENDDDTDFFFVVYDDNGDYYYTKMTKAV